MREGETRRVERKEDALQGSTQGSFLDILSSSKMVQKDSW